MCAIVLPVVSHYHPPNRRITDKRVGSFVAAMVSSPLGVPTPMLSSIMRKLEVRGHAYLKKKETIKKTVELMAPPFSK